MDQFESDQASKSKTTPKSESIPNQKQHKYKIKTKLKILTGCLCAALLVSISFNIYFAISSSEINSLRYENLQLNEKYIQLTIDYNGLNNSYEQL